MRDTSAAATTADEPIFDALLTPHRSLGRMGFRVIMAVATVLWLGSGILFLIKGAWPVFGFFGLDLAGLYVAFRLNYRAARAREEVTLWRHRLHIRQIAPSGRSREHRFNPFWARFDVARHEEAGITAMDISGEGRTVAVGSFLNPDDRESFSRAFASALATVKRR